MTKTNMKEMFAKINHEENFDKAQGMLEMLNAIYGTRYTFINRRVAYETFDHGVKTFHDAYIWAD